MTDQNDLIARAVETLKQPVRLSGDLDRRIMAEIERLPAPAAGGLRLRRAYAWLRRGRPVSVSPLGALAAAAVLVAIVLGSRVWRAQPEPTDEPVPMVAASHAAGQLMQFVLVAPGATSVALLGDFNDWSPAATPMQPEDGSGVWSASVPLTPGRYRYAFLVDGERWLQDPTAPRALEDDFGRPNSVLTIGGS